MTIYILTDIIHEAKKICDELNVPFNQGNVRGTKEERVIWIDEYNKILGRKIFKEDTLIWGSFHNLELWHRLNCEVERIKL